jgi:acyl carrier protein
MINTKEALLKFITDNAGINIDIKEEDSLDDLGFDELDRAELVMALEEEFCIVISAEEAEKFVEVKDIINYLISKNIILN